MDFTRSPSPLLNSSAWNWTKRVPVHSLRITVCVQMHIILYESQTALDLVHLIHLIQIIGPYTSMPFQGFISKKRVRMGMGSFWSLVPLKISSHVMSESCVLAISDSGLLIREIQMHVKILVKLLCGFVVSCLSLKTLYK